MIIRLLTARADVPNPDDVLRGKSSRIVGNHQEMGDHSV